MFKSKEITKEQKLEYAELLNKWETQHSLMTDSEVRRFKALDKLIGNEKKKVD